MDPRKHGAPLHCLSKVDRIAGGCDTQFSGEVAYFAECRAGE
jgi:hypothetical protein